jgi:hypothetical protein
MVRDWIAMIAASRPRRIRANRPGQAEVEYQFSVPHP